ncbi:MAG: hypothetical protein ACU833_09600 [Gammaproteobacteria bacterium]
MTTKKEKLAAEVVNAFKSILSDEAAAVLSDHEFHELERIVLEAISIELSQAADRVDEAAKDIRSQTEHLDLDL